jgi:uncharacterized membrane protein YkoI
MKRGLPILAGALAAATWAAGLAAAQPGSNAADHPNSLGAGWGQQQDEARQGVRQRRMIPLGQIVAQLRARIPGRQLDAGLEYEGDRPIYRVRWITRDGRRIDFMIDAATGQILSGG